ncbi:MAG: porin [Duodenibacillus sp.]|nr:porin [Duodenibacillus sp.]
MRGTTSYSDASALDSTVHAQQNKASVDRYGAVALQYKSGPLYAALIGDVRVYGHKPGEDVDNGYTVTAGGNYNFGVAKVYAGAQYFKDVKNSSFSAGAVKTFQTSLNEADNGYSKTAGAYLDGFGVTVGADIPVPTGQVKLVAGYMDADSGKKQNDYGQKIDVKRWGVTAGYNHVLSKRTTLYTCVGYQSDKVELKGVKVKETDLKFLAGILHRF